MAKGYEPIKLVNKTHVTLMVHGHEDDVFAYACSKCGRIYVKMFLAGICCYPQDEEKENEADDL